MQLMRFQVPFHRINHIFISHLHGDHYLGLAGLLFTMHLQQRYSDLHIHAMRGLDEILLLQLKSSRSVLNYKLIFHPIEPGEKQVLFHDDVVRVETIPLLHKIPCSGFLFRENPKPHRIDKDTMPEGMLLQHILLLKAGEDVYDANGKLLYRNRDYTLPPRHSYSYAYCSDTAPNEDMISQIEGVDLLYHEATFLDDEQEKAAMTFHSTAAQAAQIAVRAHVGQLMIGHFSARYKELDETLAEAQAIFPSTSLAIEGKIIELDADAHAHS